MGVFLCVFGAGDAYEVGDVGAGDADDVDDVDGSDANDVDDVDVECPCVRMTRTHREVYLILMSTCFLVRLL